MFDHVTLRVSDRAQSKTFYRCVLGALGVEPTHARPDFIEWDDFSILAADDAHPGTRDLHIAFGAGSREQVDSVWQAAIAAGYADDGRPGERPQYGPTYYGGFLLDPDGNSVEAVHHDDIRRGGHIDHLWIGVAELGASVAFYRTVARHTGLRLGPPMPGRRQLRGSWATSSLVGDGRPPTSGLHLAFPASDRQTVRDFHAAATAAGYGDNGGPGERQQYHPGYFAAYVLDPDGNNVECVFHGPVKPR